MKNLINFDDCKTTDESGYFEKLVRETYKHEVCFYKKDPKRKVVECYCPTTKSVFHLDYTPGMKAKDFECPNAAECGTFCKFYDTNFPQKTLNPSRIYAKLETYKDGLVMKKYDVKVDYSAEYTSGNDEEGGYPLIRDGEVTVEEVERTFFRTDGKVARFTRFARNYNPYSGWGIILRTCFRRTRNSLGVDYWYTDNFNEPLKGTAFEKTMDCIGELTEILADYPGDYFEDCLEHITKTPSLYKLYNSGFKQVVADYVRIMFRHGSTKGICDHRLHLRANSLPKILGVERSKFDKIDVAKIPLERIGNYIFAIKNNVLITPENDDIISSFKFIELITDFFNTDNASEAVKYLRKQNRLAGENTITYYYDYLEAIKYLGFDLNDKEYRYPPHVKAAHDRATEARRRDRERARNIHFYNKVKPYCGWKYCDEDKYITPVLTTDELRRWASKFHNCSFGCADRVENGRCVIFLVRLKIEPLVPYYMFEYNVQMGRIVQLHGVRNSNADDETKAFVDGFEEAYRGRRVEYA